MTSRLDTSARRRASRAGAVRRPQAGVVARGVMVVTALVAAVALQLVGPRLQCRLADLVGVPGAHPAAAVPTSTPASMPSCGTPESDADPMRPCKVATMASIAVEPAPIF